MNYGLGKWFLIISLRKYAARIKRSQAVTVETITINGYNKNINLITNYLLNQFLIGAIDDDVSDHLPIFSIHKYFKHVHEYIPKK